MNETSTGKIFEYKTLKSKIFKITVVAIAMLTGGLLVGSVAGYFSLMDKLESGTLQEVAERLPEDTQGMVVVRGLGELGRDFWDVIAALPEDPERVADIEHEFGIDLNSPMDLYDTGIDPLRPVSVAVLRLDMSLVEPPEEDKARGETQMQLDLSPEHSVVLVMIPVHDEDKAFQFASEIFPRLGLGGTQAGEEIDMGRGTAQVMAFGPEVALGVEGHFLFYVQSGDPLFDAADELKRVMDVEPDESLWTSWDFTQQRSLTDEDWYFTSWVAPSLGESSVTRYLRDTLDQPGLELVAQLLSVKKDLDSFDLGASSTVGHVSPDRVRFRTVMDLSPVLGADQIQISGLQSVTPVGNSGALPLVSGDPLVAVRVTLDTRYLWTDWFSKNSEIQRALQDPMMPPDLDKIVIENLTGNITLALVARDNPVEWTPETELSSLKGLMPSSETAAFPVEIVLGIELKDPGLLIPVLSDWGFPCAEPEIEGGIRWCMDDDVHAMGFTSNHLVYGFGMDRKAEIDAVIAGESDGFFDGLSEVEQERLSTGADLQAMVWMQNLSAQSGQTYLNEGIVRWFKLNQTRESVAAAQGDILALLASPPEPGAMAAALDQSVGPVLEALGTETDRLTAEHAEAQALQQELQAQWDLMRPAAQSADVHASPEPTPELLALGNELDEASNRANRLDLDAKVLAGNVDDLSGYVETIKLQAQQRGKLVLLAEHLSYLSISAQVWGDSAVALDFEAFPKEGSFVTGLLKSLTVEVAAR